MQTPMKDATDCKAAFDAGTITLKEPRTENTDTPATAATDIDFGDDTSHWAKDGECDDPRFEGKALPLRAARRRCPA